MIEHKILNIKYGGNLHESFSVHAANSCRLLSCSHAELSCTLLIPRRLRFFKNDNLNMASVIRPLFNLICDSILAIHAKYFNFNLQLILKTSLIISFAINFRSPADSPEEWHERFAISLDFRQFRLCNLNS